MPRSFIVVSLGMLLHKPIQIRHLMILSILIYITRSLHFRSNQWNPSHELFLRNYLQRSVLVFEYVLFSFLKIIFFAGLVVIIVLIFLTLLLLIKCCRCFNKKKSTISNYWRTNLINEWVSWNCSLYGYVNEFCVRNYLYPVYFSEELTMKYRLHEYHAETWR